MPDNDVDLITPDLTGVPVDDTAEPPDAEVTHNPTPAELGIEVQQ